MTPLNRWRRLSSRLEELLFGWKLRRRFRRDQRRGWREQRRKFRKQAKDALR